ncbi:MAG: hypothetical protein ACE5J5_01895, partial [Candidatus Hydrothermarchaeales archaeon]
INRGYGGAGEKMMEIAIPATKLDKMIDRGYAGAGEKMIEFATPATKFDEMIDQGYIKTGETFLSSVGPPAKGIGKMLEEGYKQSAIEVIKALGSRVNEFNMDDLYIRKEGEYVQLLALLGTHFDKAIDSLYVKKDGEFMEVYTPPKEEKLLLFGKYDVHIPSLEEKEPLLRSRDIFFEFTNHAAAFDLFVVDGFINLQGRVAWVISRSSDIFDLKVVDGVVNWIGDVLHNWGGSLRKPETGIIHDYASSIVLGVILIGIIALIV